MAARVQPPMFDRELTDMFMGTLRGPYFEKMTSIMSSSFSNLETIEERIEDGFKSERIQGASSSQTTKSESFGDAQKEEDDEVNVI